MNKNYVIPMLSILQNDQAEISKVAISLQTRGYSFISLPEEIIKQIDECLPSIESFFLNSESYKKEYSKEPFFGYFPVGHKESFRLITGSRLHEYKFPNNFEKIKNLVHGIDKIMYSIALILSPTLFPGLLTNAKKMDLPFFEMGKQWGMFDIAKYSNDGSRVDLNCEEHYDPGLLSLSLRSTAPGLQLRNEFGKWIIPPPHKNIAILWTGHSAVYLNPKIKPGIHRVINSEKTRISIWHEICTSAQEHRELIKDDDKKIAIITESISGIPITKTPSLIHHKNQFEHDSKEPTKRSTTELTNFTKKHQNPFPSESFFKNFVRGYQHPSVSELAPFS